MCNINFLLLSYRAIKTTRGSRSINDDLLLFVQIRFVFFPSKKEAKEIVWERCNVERIVLATEVEVMFGVGVDEIQETDQTQPIVGEQHVIKKSPVCIL